MSTTTRADLEGLHREYTEAIWNGGDVDRLGELFAEDAVVHEMTEGVDYEGLDEIAAWVEDVRTGFPDFHVDLEDVVVDGDTHVTRWTATGTHEGRLSGLDADPTHEPVEFAGVTVYRLADESVSEAWWYYDMLGILEQLGLAPTETPA